MSVRLIISLRLADIFPWRVGEQKRKRTKKVTEAATERCFHTGATCRVLNFLPSQTRLFSLLLINLLERVEFVFAPFPTETVTSFPLSFLPQASFATSFFSRSFVSLHACIFPLLFTRSFAHPRLTRKVSFADSLLKASSKKCVCKYALRATASAILLTPHTFDPHHILHDWRCKS